MKQTKALHQAQRRADPVKRRLEQSSDTVWRRSARTNQAVQEHESEQWAEEREEPGVREHESEQQAAAREEPGVREHESEQRAAAREEPGVQEQEQSVNTNTVRRAIAREEPGVLERESLQRAAARDEPGVLERESLQRAAAREEPGVLEHESRQRAAAREEPGVLESKRESLQRAAAREEPVVWEHETELRAEARQDPAVQARESRQRAVARGKKTYVMVCKCINGDYLFYQPCGGLWNEFCVYGCGYIHLLNSTPGTRKKCCVNGLLSSASDNFDEELMMGYVLDELLVFVRKVISNSNTFSQKSSTYNNLVAMAATVTCNYNETAGFVQANIEYLYIRSYGQTASVTSNLWVYSRT